MTSWNRNMIQLTAIAATLTLLAGCGSPTATNSSNSASAPVGVTKNSAGTNTTRTNSSAAAAGNNAPAELTHTKVMQWKAPPAMQIDVNKQYDAVVHTNYGDFTIQLFAKDAPQTVNNFVFLAQHHFYQNDTFFRIIQDFMIQTGDPLNNGTGGPGYTTNDELPPKLPYTTGIVAMAKTSMPNTNGSQFFICTGAQSAGLSPDYTEIGKVVKGMDVVSKIAAIPVVANAMMNGEMSKPTKKAYIETIDIQVQ